MSNILFLDIYDLITLKLEKNVSVNNDSLKGVQV
jgi:hypothetical protein